MNKQNTRATWMVWPTLAVVIMVLAWLMLPRLLLVQPVYLVSDILAFILVASVIFMVAYIRQKEHLLAPWREVLHRKLAMIALMVITVYLLIGLLDSIHFRLPLTKQKPDDITQYSVEVMSVFDKLAVNLRSHTEETYSAPFAAFSHSKKTQEDTINKAQIRDYPRLRYGGAHLQEPTSQRLADILLTCVKAIIYSMLLWLFIVVASVWKLARRQQQSWSAQFVQIWRGKTLIPWNIIYLTTAIFLITVFALVMLSQGYHVFGTDKVGQDVLYLSLKSIRTGILIGTLATLVMLPFAILLGIMAGYFRGVIDDVIQYIYTTLSSIPGVLLIAASILTMQVYIEANKDLFPTIAARSDLRLVALCVILGITSWTGLCRLLRGETMKLREIDYVQAATALGVGHFRIMLRHVLPNVMHIVLIAMVLDFSGLVLAEAVLSYVGVGVDQSTMSWGNMINSARLELAREPIVWWPLLAAFIMMFILVLAANLFADAVRDAFDPKLRQLTGKG